MKDADLHFLSDRYEGKVFLQPDRPMVERYILPRTDSIIVSTLIAQAPRREVNGIPTPKIEKILVDVFADDERFFVFQGQELEYISNDIFERYWISEKTLFRYAERRKVGRKLRGFINQKTDVQLLQYGETQK